MGHLTLFWNNYFDILKSIILSTTCLFFWGLKTEFITNKIELKKRCKLSLFGWISFQLGIKCRVQLCPKLGRKWNKLSASAKLDLRMGTERKFQEKCYMKKS
jgi:hypothetical protein